MDLWVRTQDKRHLLKVDIINWFGGEIYTNNQVDLETKKDGETYLLGRYCDGKRTLEVLDEIHQRIINIQCIEITGANYINNQMKKNGIDCVYQMPSK